MIKLLIPLLLPLFLSSCKKTATTPEQPSMLPTTHDADSLRKTLYEQCKMNHKPLNYRQLWTALKIIDGEGDSVRLIYSQELRSKSLNGGRKGDWNREHVWAKSYGIDKSGADFTDLYNIFACDMQINSRRGNKCFDNETDKDSWEPPENMKDDIARAMFYMAIRYEGNEPNTEDLILNDEPNSDRADFGNLSTLLKWHKSDPIDARELERANRVEQIQGNHNPFLDDPEYAEIIFGKKVIKKIIFL